MVGNAWKLGGPTVRTEYVGVIVDRREQQAILQALGSYLAEVRWDEMIIADASARSMSMIESGLSQTLALSRVVRSESEGVVIPTQGGQFTDWLSRLGKNTRLKAYNRRELFEGTLNGSFEEWQTPPETFLALLNRFHCERWGGKPCFDDNAVRFHESLLNRLSGSQSARMSVLRADNQIVSVLYDVRAGNRVYNLQAGGFMQDFHNKLSLGTLHLGYAIERSFQDSSIVSYDLLAGSGKNTFYKQHFRGGRRCCLPPLSMFVLPFLKWLMGGQGGVVCLPPV